MPRRSPAGCRTSVVVAAADLGLAVWVRERLGGDRFRVYTDADATGVELAGCAQERHRHRCRGVRRPRLRGQCQGGAAARGLVEMTRFGVAHGAEAATFAGLAGIGDLIATCFSPHGRNRRVGERLGRGEPLDAVLAGPQVAEGVYTSRGVHERVRQIGIDAPIMTGVYQLLHEGRSPLDVVQDLMMRRQRHEKG